MVESSVKSLSKPVFDKLEPKLGQLDDFACRQLDKVRLTLSNPCQYRQYTVETIFTHPFPFLSVQFEKVYPKSEAHAFPSPTSSARSSYDLLRQDNGSESYFVQRPRGDSIDSIDSTSSSSSRPSFDILRSRNPRHEEGNNVNQIF